MQASVLHTSARHIHFKLKYVLCVFGCVTKGQRSGEFPYPAFPCGPHQVTPAAVSSQLWFPPGSAHAVLEGAEPVASAYELTPETGRWWVKCRLCNYVWGLVEQSTITGTDKWVEQPAEPVSASSALRFISTKISWWLKHFTELHKDYYLLLIHCIFIAIHPQCYMVVFRR